MVWLILCANVATIAVSFKKRMLLYSVLNAIFLFLVTGQAFEIQADLQGRHTVYFLLNFISDAGFNLALWYVLGVSIVSLMFAIVSKGYRRNAVAVRGYTFSPTRRFYLLLFSFLVLIASVLIFVVVGLSQFLSSSRPGFQTGATIFIVLLFLGIVPLLLKILSRSPIRAGDLACFGVSFLVTAGFSRIHLILYLLILLLALFYARGWVDAPITVAMTTKVVVFGIIAAAAFFVIGALHDAQNFVSGSLSSLVQYIMNHPQKSILSIQYNYRVGIEGMSGVAGAFSRYLAQPHLTRFDFGASWLLQGATQWLPGILKHHITGVDKLAEDISWQSSSIVSTGVETSFESFGWLGMFLYPLAVYILAWRIPLLILKKRISASLEVIFYMLYGCYIFFVRGNLPTWIAFSFSYTVVIVAFWPMFQRHIHRTHAEANQSPVAL